MVVFHTFRSESELQNEAKGDYINLQFEVPDHLDNIRLSLVTKNGENHPNSLFVTPFKSHWIPKNQKQAKKRLTPKDHDVILKKENGNWEVDFPKYQNRNEVEKLVGEEFWNPDTKIMTLGKNGRKNGLRLTILKAAERTKDSKINVKDMVQELGICENGFDLGKCKLKIGNIGLSDLYLDKKKYWIEEINCMAQEICASPRQGIFVEIPSTKISVKEELTLLLVVKDKIFESFECHKTSNSVFLFLIDLNQEIIFENNQKLTGIAFVIFQDVDISENDVVFQGGQKGQEVYINPHKENDPSCFCQTRKPNIEGKIKNFNRKRTASGSSNESRKRIATGEIKTGDSPSEASPMSDFNIENLDTNLPNLTTEEVDLLLKDGRNLEGIIPSYEERPKIKNGDIFPKIGNFDWKICAAFALFALPTILFQVFQL